MENQMDQKSSFFECELFKQDINIFANKFIVNQKEILLDEIVAQQAKFKAIDVEYVCKFTFAKETFDKTKPFIIIPSRNNIELIKYTLNNLFENKIEEICNIMIVDDRSTDDYQQLLKQFNISLLRVDNEKGFNFSMLCNIGAYIANKLDCTEIILWNNDLWVEKREYLETVLKKHREDNSVLSGTKLLYPLKSFDGNSEDSENIKQHFPNMKDGKWRGTVQFGGGAWAQFPNTPILFSPLHFKRFAQPTNNLVNCDKGETFVTGAFHLYNLDWFIKNGGLNPSLSKNFQDVDICLRVVEQGKKVMYYGKDVYFLHDESLTFNSAGEKKNDKQMTSDHVLFGKIWNSKLVGIVL
jgi:GT2 family glycosyltransferase